MEETVSWKSYDGKNETSGQLVTKRPQGSPGMEAYPYSSPPR